MIRTRVVPIEILRFAQNDNITTRSFELLQLRVFRFGLLKGRQVGVGIFPSCK